MTSPLSAKRSIATFDSGPSTLGAVARFLHGRDFAGLGIVPPTLARVLEPAVPVLNRLPPHARRAVYSWSGRPETVRAADAGRVRSDRIAAWMASRYPERRYPAVAVGAANGALAHLCAALDAPLLPQTFLVPLRQHGRHVDEPQPDIEFAREPARRLLQRNPDVQLHHMQDPNQDRLMLRHITYLRAKWRRLPAAFERFLIERLEPGGTIIVADCRLRWPVTRIAARHVFQFGGVGGVPADEYRRGSPRIERYLEQHRSHRRRWAPPAADEDCAEAEWGFAPALSEDVERLAQRHGWRLARLEFDEPDALAAPVADLHRAWYSELGRPDDRLLVESFALLDPWWALRTSSVPFWLTFAVDPSADRLEAYLDAARPFEEIRVTAFPHGIESVGAPGIERWLALARRATGSGALVGIDAQAYPSDLAGFWRFHADLRAIPHRDPLPEPLRVEDVGRMLGQHDGVNWREEAAT